MSSSVHAELVELLRPARLTHVVDIGANPINEPPPYRPLLDAQLCHVTGFEPQPSAFAQLQLKKAPNEVYLPFAIGDGNEHTLHICAFSGFTSTFVPSPAALEVFRFSEDAEVVEQMRVQTRRLDDLAEITGVDFLKIDIQAGELAVFVHGRRKLENAVAIQTEVQFVDLYEGQPSFGQIDQELRSQGFIPHHFAKLIRRQISPLRFRRPGPPIHQLLEADVVYVRDFVHPDGIDSEQLKHLCLIAHVCYQSFDLAGRCVALLEQRNAVREGALQDYIRILKALASDRRTKQEAAG